jgi:trehalose 6-phosphate phosphatase
MSLGREHDIHPLGSDDLLAGALRRAATAKSLLIVCDYDGTLAPIVLDPAAAGPAPGAVDAVRELNALPRTHVALLSGRSRRDLMKLTGLGERTDTTDLRLVGSHGAEHGPVLDPSEPIARQARLVTDALRDLTRGVTGVLVEPKPYGAAVHVRGASEADAERVVDSVLEGPAKLPGVRVLHGKSVVELSVVDADKGEAIRRLAREVDADIAVAIGDDETDEWMFAALAEGSVSVKVGPGETGARFRVTDVAEVVELVRSLARERAAYLAAPDDDHP